MNKRLTPQFEQLTRIEWKDRELPTADVPAAVQEMSWWQFRKAAVSYLLLHLPLLVRPYLDSVPCNSESMDTDLVCDFFIIKHVNVIVFI